jgi:hypothetical protein
LYLNPIRNDITIELAANGEQIPCAIRISDGLGRKRLEEKIATSVSIKINLRGLPSGMFIAEHLFSSGEAVKRKSIKVL